MHEDLLLSTERCLSGQELYLVPCLGAVVFSFCRKPLSPLAMSRSLQCPVLLGVCVVHKAGYWDAGVSVPGLAK